MSEDSGNYQTFDRDERYQMAVNRVQRVPGSTGRLTANIRAIEYVGEELQEAGGIIRCNPKPGADGLHVGVFYIHSNALPVLGGWLVCVGVEIQCFEMNLKRGLCRYYSERHWMCEDAGHNCQQVIQQICQDLLAQAIEEPYRQTGSRLDWVIVVSGFDPGSVGVPYVWVNLDLAHSEPDQLLIGLECPGPDLVDIQAVTAVFDSPQYAIARSAIGTERLLKGFLEPYCRTAAVWINEPNPLGLPAAWYWTRLANVRVISVWLRWMDSQIQQPSGIKRPAPIFAEVQWILDRVLLPKEALEHSRKILRGYLLDYAQGCQDTMGALERFWLDFGKEG